MIKEFIKQQEHLEAFLTGPAGSGKTTALYDIITELNDLRVTYKVVAYTHKAKEILISKLPKKTDISTLHSWLKKRPGINEKAQHIKALMTSKQHGKPEPLQLLIVDEFSFVGEKDYMSIGDLQDPLMLEEYHCELCGPTDLNEMESCESCNGHVKTTSIQPLKVLYVGDLNQLSPIDGPPAVIPCEPFWKKLTKIYRSTSDISKPLSKLVQMIEGNISMGYLEPTESFLRNQNIDDLYKTDSEDKIMLAFTNEAVQEHNIAIQGYSEPKPGDVISIPTFSNSGFNKLILKQILNKYEGSLQTVNGIISMQTKYSPLQYINTLKYIKFYEFTNGFVVAGIFGSYENKKIRSKLGNKLVNANKGGRDSKKLYREYKTVSDFVAVMDFNHCMTIHKSQGSEYTNVYVDSSDLAKCINKNERMKLLYVAMSRSKNKIFLNN